MFSPNNNSYLAWHILDVATPKMNFGLMVMNLYQLLINLTRSQFVFLGDMFELDRN